MQNALDLQSGTSKLPPRLRSSAPCMCAMHALYITAQLMHCQLYERYVSTYAASSLSCICSCIARLYVSDLAACCIWLPTSAAPTFYAGLRSILTSIAGIACAGLVDSHTAGASCHNQHCTQLAIVLTESQPVPRPCLVCPSCTSASLCRIYSDFVRFGACSFKLCKAGSSR